MKKGDPVTYVDKGVTRTGTVSFVNHLGAGVSRDGRTGPMSQDYIPKADWNKSK
jgi:hypothetical protein